MKKMKYLMLMTLLVIGCGKDNPKVDIPDEPEQKLSSYNILGSFTFIDEATEKWRNAEIKDNVITAIVETPFVINALTATVTISDKATISPDPTQKRDYTNPVIYTVTAEDGSKAEYKVIVTQRLLSESYIRGLRFKEVKEYHAYNNPYPTLNTPEANANIKIIVPANTDVTKLTSVFEISDGATIYPKQGQTLDYTNPVEYTVTSEDGKTVLKYTVTVAFDKLPELRIAVITGDTFRNIQGGETIAFEVNTLPRRENIQVTLINHHNENLRVPLTIQNVDEDNKKIYVQLPDTYLNGRYKLHVSIAQDNKATSDTFVLDSGTPVFRHITDRFSTSNPRTSITSLLLISELFEVEAYVNAKDFGKHSFFIKKNGEYVQLENAIHRSDYGNIVLEAPLNIPATSLQTGTDYEFVIRYEDKEYAYPLINDKNEPIKVYVPREPVVTGISKTTITQGDTFVIQGSNLFYPFNTLRSDAHNSKLAHYATIKSYHTGNSYRETLSTSKNVDAQGNLVVRIPFGITAGEDYNLHVESNIRTFGVDTPFTIKVELPKPTHPTMRIKSAEVYDKNSQHFPGQLRIVFNGNISNVSFKRIVFPSNTSNFENFFVYANSIMTAQLNNLQYDDIYIRRQTGYVLFEENGKEYRLYFTPERKD